MGNDVCCSKCSMEYGPSIRGRLSVRLSGCVILYICWWSVSCLVWLFTMWGYRIQDEDVIVDDDVGGDSG